MNCRKDGDYRQSYHVILISIVSFSIILFLIKLIFILQLIQVIIQIAQIPTVLFVLFKWWCFPNHFDYVKINYLILSIGILSCLLLSFFWNKTVYLWNEEKSISLYALNFTMAILGMLKAN